MLKVQSSWRRLGDMKRCQKEGSHGNDSWDVFSLILMDMSMTHFLMTQHSSWWTCLILAQWLDSFITLFPHISYHSHDESNVLPFVILVYSYDSFSCAASSFFPWLHYCAYWGCTSWLISDSILTHFILHAGRIFQQWHHNHIVCLVIETALHVYKGQFSPWLGKYISCIHQIQSLLQSKYSLSTWPPDFICFGVSKLLDICSHSYIIICWHKQLSG